MKKLFASAVLCVGLLIHAPQMMAQTLTQATSSAASQTFSNEQIIPLTVAQAWFKGSQSEANFFQMVAQLTVLSATNRGLKMPDDATTGKKCGVYFKTAAAKDPQQLLYVVVDSMVQKFGIKG